MPTTNFFRFHFGISNSLQLQCLNQRHHKNIQFRVCNENMQYDLCVENIYFQIFITPIVCHDHQSHISEFGQYFNVQSIINRVLLFITNIVFFFFLQQQFGWDMQTTEEKNIWNKTRRNGSTSSEENVCIRSKNVCPKTKKQQKSTQMRMVKKGIRRNNGLKSNQTLEN